MDLKKIHKDKVSETLLAKSFTSLFTVPTPETESEFVILFRYEGGQLYQVSMTRDEASRIGQKMQEFPNGWMEEISK